MPVTAWAPCWLNDEPPPKPWLPEAAPCCVTFWVLPCCPPDDESNTPFDPLLEPEANWPLELRFWLLEPFDPLVPNEPDPPEFRPPWVPRPLLEPEPNGLPLVVGAAFGVPEGEYPPADPELPSSHPRMTDRPRSSSSIVRSSKVGCWPPKSMRTRAFAISAGISPPIGRSAKKSPESRTRRIAGRDASISLPTEFSTVTGRVGVIPATRGTWPVAQAASGRAAAPVTRRRARPRIVVMSIPLPLGAFSGRPAGCRPWSRR